MRRPLSILKLPSRSGSLIRPFAGQRVAQRLQALGVFDGGLRVVDRARAHHHCQAVVTAVQDLVQGRARGADGVGGFIVTGQHRQQLGRRCQRFDGADAQVVGVRGHCRRSPERWGPQRGGMKKAARFAGGFRECV